MNDGYAYQEQIEGPSVGRTVLEHLTARHAHSTPEQWAQRIAGGEVVLDGAVAHAADLLRAGQQLVWHRPAWDEPAAPLDFEVLHQDDALVVVGKPSGLPTLPGAGFLQHTLLRQVQRRWPDAVVAHRLGRFTSGLVLCPRGPAAAKAVQDAFSAGSVEKEYLALAEGTVLADDFEVAVPIGPVPYAPLGTVHAANAQGKKARSVVHVVQRRAEGTLVRVQLLTGRPHQIRIHLAAVGHPLVGDPLYGPGGVPRPDTRAVPGDPGYLLHAARVALPHPRTGVRLELFCQAPGALSASAR